MIRNRGIDMVDHISCLKKVSSTLISSVYRGISYFPVIFIEA